MRNIIKIRKSQVQKRAWLFLLKKQEEKTKKDLTKKQKCAVDFIRL